MEEGTISIIISVIALVVALFSFFKSGQNKKPNEKEAPPKSPQTMSLRLQAYERLVILCERISLPSLISRTNSPELSAKEMQVVLSENIKMEFEYNASQQIYVTTAAWDAVQNLKNQNLLIINRIATVMRPDASALDLNKQILEVIMSQKERSLHSVVLESLSVEAKRLM